VQDAVGRSHVASPTLFCQSQFPSKQVEKSYSQGQPMSHLRHYAPAHEINCTSARLES
jgi:hypothetical protein